MDDKPSQVKQVPIKRVYPDTLESHFVSNFVVQHQPDAFILSFFEIWPPVISGETPEERLLELREIESVDAKCVSRIVLTPERMQELCDVMQANLEKHKALYRDMYIEEPNGE